MPISIKGDTKFVTMTEAALELLKTKVSAHYQIVLANIGIIQQVETGSGMYAWETPPRYAVGRATVVSGVVWYASSIVHEANHSRQYQAKVSYSGKEAEEECLNLQREALVMLGAPQAVIDYVGETLKTEYWNNPHRWW